LLIVHDCFEGWMQLRRELDSNKEKFAARVRARRRIRILPTRAAIKEASARPA
jgi:hypothetical protein